MARTIYLILTVFLAVSCTEIFSTRDPEPPDGNSGLDLNETAAGLIASFKTSLLALDAYKYESLFLNNPASEEKYSFVSEASDIVRHDVFSDWDIEKENKFLNGLKNSSVVISDIVLDHEPLDETAEVLKINISYGMNVTGEDGPYPVAGTFIFDLVKNNSHFWYIRTWTDLSPAGNVSFSKLKEPYAL